ncbi:MAG: nucleotide-binding protein [Prevotella sp.]|nr:nucleotide-binding protein [Prevotella sp.]
MVTIDLVENFFDHYKLIKYQDSNLEVPIELYHKWYDSAIELFSLYFQPGDNLYDKFTSVDNSGNGFTLHSNFSNIRGTYKALISRIQRNMKEKRNNEVISKNKVFIVHGHNEAIREKVARVVERLGLGAIILNEIPNEGGTIIEKFEKNSSEADFVIVLLTADDECKAKQEREFKYRARQNVIFELGFFIGKISRSHLFILLEEGVEVPSDLNGIGYTPMNDGWDRSLVKELRRCGYNVDANNLP